MRISYALFFILMGLNGCSYKNRPLSTDGASTVQNPFTTGSGESASSANPVNPANPIVGGTGSIPPPIIELAAQKTSIEYGTYTNLDWVVAIADKCYLSYQDKLINVDFKGKQSTGVLISSTKFTLTCTNAGGKATKDITIGVLPFPLLTGPTDAIGYNTSANLSWQSDNAEKCTLSPSVGDATIGLTGTRPTGNLTSSVKYSLTCSNDVGFAVSSLTIKVNPPPPTVSLTAVNSAVNYGAATTLNWTSTNATGCTLNSPAAGTTNVALSGIQSSGLLSQATTFLLTCNNVSGYKTSTVTVNTNYVLANRGLVINFDRMPFDGRTNYMDIGNYGGLYDTSNLTIATWVYPTSLNQRGTAPNNGSNDNAIGGSILASNNTTGNKGQDGGGYVFGIRWDGLLWWWPNAFADKYSNARVPLSKWTYVAVTYTNGVVNMYVNGALDSSQSSEQPRRPTYMHIGDASWITGFFQGTMGNYTMYNRALSDVEIWQNCRALQGSYGTGICR